ncbi:MAG TPA: 2-oxoglutarate dehydrogenase complex dihydrolipoyllysine-residue succinyltransferase [Thiomonas arsenitoxydans]|jgi:2-oxoglutarate dehydrogenase E2 component (dihydrolipoamide succinyltransferase)|uniref:Dihydrolipoyllysine-residue succinyltransferase component of 2-oxoglutarate dehydrogenase complex n=1 Tax=Thiomonas intermedia (strain K12) TaxID=75379 RepID=D5X0T6_THIK1|nr:2-oxoglutarate dehydrogenase complex dihydrolipoyllysine-residue succinyltransferase [Thiomonas sp.]HOI67273.1 2-oxoglutarate dehydrogenase complex dihydrolipoyllysine-residue succinyltransferase [Thiomonas arsenitoxydans]
MALIDIKVPQLSESVAEATLLTWKKKPGEPVAQDEILIEIETDKVVLEVPAPEAGVMAQILKNDGESVTSDEVIAKIDTEAKPQTSPLPVAPVKAAEPTASAPAAVATAAPSAGAAVAMPAAAKIMAEQGVNPSDVAGTGRGGRITKGDALQAAAAPKPPTVPAPTPAPKPATAAAAMPSLTIPALQPVEADLDLAAYTDRPEQRVPMSRLRARIAERLLQSQATNAILTTFNEVNMKPVIDMRNLYKDKFEKQHGVKLGFMSFFVRAAVHALRKFPLLNASIDGNDIVYHGYFDIGIAVGSPRGLVVPILRNADQMSFADIEKAIADFGAKARDGKLTIEELTGGTFSISNGGVFGSMLSTPIINPPQSAILGIHATKDRPVVEDGQIVIRPMNYLALSYDHRLIDGREAVLSLVAMKEALEDPARLLLDL